jgi:hypothetical protein
MTENPHGTIAAEAFTVFAEVCSQFKSERSKGGSLINPHTIKLRVMNRARRCWEFAPRRPSF